MTDRHENAIWQRLDRWGTRARDAMFVGSVAGAVLAVTFPGFVWLLSSIFEDFVSAQVRAVLGIDAIVADIREVRGEDRVLRERDDGDFAYVEEPVYEGDPVILRLFLSKTKLGQACQLADGSVIFEDDRGYRLSGGAVRVNVTENMSRFRVVIQPPKQLSVGRTAVWLSLRYDCGDTKVYDRTSPLQFKLRPAAEKNE